MKIDSCNCTQSLRLPLLYQTCHQLSMVFHYSTHPAPISDNSRKVRKLVTDHIENSISEGFNC